MADNALAGLFSLVQFVVALEFLLGALGIALKHCPRSFFCLRRICRGGSVRRFSAIRVVSALGEAFGKTWRDGPAILALAVPRVCRVLFGGWARVSGGEHRWKTENRLV